MSLIVCQVIADRPDQLTFTWSDGTNSFEPYSLTRLPLDAFRAAVRVARERLAELVQLHLDPTPPEQLREASHALALAGRMLYEAIFAPDAEQISRATVVRNWLAELNTRQPQGETFEVVLEADLYVPWNVVYDQPPPDPDDFRPAPENLQTWLPFWGVRYNLACGRRVNPLRRLPQWERPEVILVIDPQIRADLPDEERQRRRLIGFAASRGCRVVESRAQLAAALRENKPYLVYWLSHATPNALVLGDTEISPTELMTLLRGDPLAHSTGRRGLLFLNACQTGRGGRAGSFLDAVYSAGLSGLIATEELTINTFANPFGLDFLEAFLDSGECVGKALHRLRSAGLPLGLLYTAYCPPDIQITKPPTVEPQPRPRGRGTDPAPPVGEAPSSIIHSRPRFLPQNPYRGLAPYDRDHRALFAGRDADVQRFAELVNEPGARLIVLHGAMGVGKSSFLRAGLLPYLEEECVGYRALRNQREGENDDAPALFIAASRDLVGQTAKALADFAARPYRYKTPQTPDAPEGRLIEVPLPDLLRDLILPARSGKSASADPVDPARVRAAIAADPSLPGRFLGALGDVLPFGLVLVIDQLEEIFTLAQTDEDTANRRTALAMLRHALEPTGDFKVILAVRTDYYGRLTDVLRKGLRDLRGVRDYLLTDLDRDGLLEAVRRPTSPEAGPYASEQPRRKYNFTYADGVAEQIVRQSQEASRGTNDTALLLIQILCSQLYTAVRQRSDRIITARDLEQVGGVAGSTRAHADALLDRLVKQFPDQPTPNPARGRGLLEWLLAYWAPQTSDKVAFKRLFRRLYVRQPDGNFTSGLALSDGLATRWRGRAPYRQVIAAAAGDDFRLLRETSLLEENQERLYLSLGHDALAPVAAEWDEEQQSWRRLRDAVTVGLLLACAALVLIAALSYTLLLNAEAVSKVELIRSSRQSSALTADFAADKVPWKVRRYWRILEEEVQKESQLPTWLGDAETPSSGEKLQAWVRERAKLYPPPGDGAWAFLDARGIQVANSKAPELIGKDFSYRDYFHGQGGNTEDLRNRWGPIQKPHLSTPFEAAIKNSPPRVACSIPVRKDGPGRPVVGVLVLTVDPLEFLALPESVRGRDHRVLFIDRYGKVVGQCAALGGVSEISAQCLAALEETPAPSIELEGARGERWIAVRKPIRFDREGEEDPQWSVIVAADETEVTRPVVGLRGRVLWSGVIAFSLVFVTLAAVIPLLASRLRPTG